MKHNLDLNLNTAEYGNDFLGQTDYALITASSQATLAKYVTVSYS